MGGEIKKKTAVGAPTIRCHEVHNHGTPSDPVNHGTPSAPANHGAPSEPVNHGIPSDPVNVPARSRGQI